MRVLWVLLWTSFVVFVNVGCVRRKNVTEKIQNKTRNIPRSPVLISRFGHDISSSNNEGIKGSALNHGLSNNVISTEFETEKDRTNDNVIPRRNSFTIKRKEKKRKIPKRKYSGRTTANVYKKQQNQSDLDKNIDLIFVSEKQNHLNLKNNDISQSLAFTYSTRQKKKKKVVTKYNDLERNEINKLAGKSVSSPMKRVRKLKKGNNVIFEINKGQNISPPTNMPSLESPRRGYKSLSTHLKNINSKAKPTIKPILVSEATQKPSDSNKKVKNHDILQNSPVQYKGSRENAGASKQSEFQLETKQKSQQQRRRLNFDPRRSQISLNSITKAKQSSLLSKKIPSPKKLQRNLKSTSRLSSTKVNLRPLKERKANFKVIEGKRKNPNSESKEEDSHHEILSLNLKEPLLDTRQSIDKTLHSDNFQNPGRDINVERKNRINIKTRKSDRQALEKQPISIDHAKESQRVAVLRRKTSKKVNSKKIRNGFIIKNSSELRDNYTIRRQPIDNVNLLESATNKTISTTVSRDRIRRINPIKYPTKTDVSSIGPDLKNITSLQNENKVSTDHEQSSAGEVLTTNIIRGQRFSVGIPNPKYRSRNRLSFNNFNNSPASNLTSDSEMKGKNTVLPSVSKKLSLDKHILFDSQESFGIAEKKLETGNNVTRNQIVKKNNQFQSIANKDNIVKRTESLKKSANFFITNQTIPFTNTKIQRNKETTRSNNNLKSRTPTSVNKTDNKPRYSYGIPNSTSKFRNTKVSKTKKDQISLTHTRKESPQVTPSVGNKDRYYYSKYIDLAINQAQITWAQDPFRRRTSTGTDKPLFDIDFTKDPHFEEGKIEESKVPHFNKEVEAGDKVYLQSPKDIISKSRRKLIQRSMI